MQLSQPRSILPALLFLGATSCGNSSSDNANTPGDSDAPGACQDRASTGSVTQVDLRVNSPLPTAFTANCPYGAVSTLKAYLLDALPTGACELTVAASGVSGCCEGVPADQNPWLTIAYRETGLSLWLAEQGKMVLIPSTSPPVVAVSFSGAPVDRPYDTDGDGTDNLAEWCAGTLSY
jgi:hypothetical protein